MTITHPSKQNLALAVVVCAIGCFFFAAGSACSKLVSHQISIYTILFFQNLICLILTTPQIVNKGLSSLKTKKWGLHLARDILGLLTFFFLFSSLKSIPLVVGLLLNNTGPLWIPLIALIWLRVRMDSHVWWGVIIGFIGIVFILRPGVEAFSAGSILAILSGITWGITFLVVGKLASTEPTHRTLFYYFLFGTLVTAPFAFSGSYSLTQIDYLYLLGVGAFIFLGQMLITYSFQHGKVSIIAPVTYVTVIFSGVFDWVIWNHLPTLFTVSGIILVVLGAIAAIYFEKRSQNKLTKP
jgi:drug/metabolite transporter (DMT)-like permease